MLIEKVEERDFITDEEVVLKRDLIAILKDDGHGNHHALYAKVLKDFPVKIVPVDHQIKTAAIDSEEKVIYFNRGFFKNKETFYQLQVIVRHELLHFLLDHYIRQVAYWQQNIPEAHLKLSNSLHDIFNIAGDFEISNKKYTEWDKSVVRETKINGKIIHGLITEEHRSGWKDMTLEQMLDAIDKEMEKFNYSGEIENKVDWQDSPVLGQFSGNLARSADMLTNYKRHPAVSSYLDVAKFKHNIEKNIKKSRGPNAKLFDEWTDIFDVLPEKIKDYSKDELLNLISKIQESKPWEQVKLIDKNNSEIITLYTPEEKDLGIEIISILLNKFNYQDDYNAWYNEIMNKIPNLHLSKKEIEDLLKCLK